MTSHSRHVLRSSLSALLALTLGVTGLLGASPAQAVSDQATPSAGSTTSAEPATSTGF